MPTISTLTPTPSADSIEPSKPLCFGPGVQEELEIAEGGERVPGHVAPDNDESDTSENALVKDLVGGEPSGDFAIRELSSGESQ